MTSPKRSLIPIHVPLSLSLSLANSFILLKKVFITAEFSITSGHGPKNHRAPLPALSSAPQRSRRLTPQLQADPADLVPRARSFVLLD